MSADVPLVRAVVCAWVVSACGFPRPTPLGVDDAGADAVTMDAGSVDGIRVDGPAPDASSTPICTSDQARCDGDDLVRCNAEGTAEVMETCALGCDDAELRCEDVQPSNGLATLLDLTTSEPALDLGTSATINTDSGTVTVDGASVVVKSTTLVQTSAPTLRVFIVRGLTAADVKITGTNAFAVVSDGDVHISAVFAASASAFTAGAGAFNSGACKGGDQAVVLRGLGGAGGGGFGLSGGKGGTAANDNGTATGAAAGSAAGNATLVPLRGGCDSGKVSGSFGGGGGAIQLVSRTAIVISGVVATNGSATAGGGSGGGILLEAPRVDISGGVVANGGGGGGGCIGAVAGENGRLDTVPASAGIGCATSGGVDGGSGGAGNTGATNGASISMAGDTSVFAGHGGGGVGRIRVNTAPGGLRTTGLFSPNPSTGALATR